MGGGRWGWSRGDARNNIGMANRGPYSSALMRKWNAAKQKSSRRAVRPPPYISKTDGRFHLLGFLYNIKGGGEG